MQIIGVQVCRAHAPREEKCLVIPRTGLDLRGPGGCQCAQRKALNMNRLLN
jgi:hypothetical protein